MIGHLTHEQMLDRSLELSKTSNEHSRAAGQACILINGGAATAVIAYLSKDKLDPIVIPDASISLGLYAAGVLFAALMIICATQCLDDYSMYWLRSTEGERHQASLDSGTRWWYGYKFAGALSIVSFLVASFWFCECTSRRS